MPSADARRLGATLLALIAAQVGLHGCLNGMRLAVPLLAAREEWGAGMIGVLMALFAAFPFLIAIPAGRLADRHGYHFPTRLASLLALAGATLGVLSTHVAMLGIGAALTGAGSAIGMITLQRSAGRLAHDAAQRLRVFSWVALAPSIATLIGPVLAGVLLDQAGPRMAFAGLALLPLATLVVTLFVPGEPARCVQAAGKGGIAWDLLAGADVRRLFFVNWLITACWDAHAFALPILGHERGLSASAIGAVLAAYAVASALVRLTIPFVAGRLETRSLMTAALALTAAVFLLYPWLDSPWAMAACAATLGVGLGAIQPAVLSMLQTLTPPERMGEALGLRSTVIHFSTLVMPLGFGALGATLGVAPVFWLTGLALTAGAWQSGRIAGAAASGPQAPRT